MRSQHKRAKAWVAMAVCGIFLGCSGARDDSINRLLGSGDAARPDDTGLDTTANATPDSASGNEEAIHPEMDARLSEEAGDSADAQSANEDASIPDAGSIEDASIPDADTIGFDADIGVDAGSVSDASVEAAVADAELTDSSTADAGPACLDGDAASDGSCLAELPLFSTGLDSNSVVLAGGSIDPHYTLVQSADTTFTGPDAIVVSEIAAGYWTAQSATSAWIAPSSNQMYPGATPCNAAGTYVYRTTFDLTGFDLASATIAGQWGADNIGVDVRLNGVSLGIAASGYAPLTPFAIASGFVPGINTLEFELTDYGCPNGLRVELSGTALLAR